PDQATTVPPARSAALQPADRAGLSAEGGLPAVLGVRVTELGRQVPRRMVLSGHALAYRADEEDCQDATLAPGADPELFPRQEAVLQRCGRGSQQQGQTDHAKILRLPNLPRHRTRAVPCTWQTAGA